MASSDSNNSSLICEFESDRVVETVMEHSAVEFEDVPISFLQNESNTETEGRESSLARAEKRDREFDPGEEWTTVMRRRKLMAITTDDESSRIPEEIIEISVSSTDKLPKQIGLARLLKSENISDIVKIKFINSYKVLIFFNNEDSAEKLIQNNTLKSRGFRCQKTLEIGVSYGVVRDIDEELTDEEIKDNISSDVPILYVKRLRRRDLQNGGWEDCEAVRICFQGSSLPLYVYTHNTRVAVSPYMFPVTQCSKCWRFGHTVRTCPSTKFICPKCANAHQNCESLHYKCVNCSGKHMALAKVCPKYLKEKKIREIMAEFNCSYRRALTMYVPPSPDPPLRQSARAPLASTQAAPSHSIESNETPYNEMNSEITYAQIVSRPCRSPEIPHRQVYIARTPELTGKKDKKKSKPKKSCVQEVMDWFIPSESEDETIIQNEKSGNLKGENKKKTKPRVRELVLKLKEAILCEEIESQEKLKSCANILLEWVVSFAVSYITDWSWIKGFIAQDDK